MKDFSGPIRQPVARKNHTCDLCGQDIVKGKKYTRWTGIVQGVFYDTKCHVACGQATQAWTWEDWVAFEPGTLVRGLNKIRFPHNPAHTSGTCCNCGKELVFNVPRMGEAGGFIHKDTYEFICPESLAAFKARNDN
jgi:hypothetical protein